MTEKCLQNCLSLQDLPQKKKLHDVTLFLLHTFTAKKNYTDYNIHGPVEQTLRMSWNSEHFLIHTPKNDPRVGVTSLKRICQAIAKGGGGGVLAPSQPQLTNPSTHPPTIPPSHQAICLAPPAATTTTVHLHNIILPKMHACRRCAHLWAISDFFPALGVGHPRECRGDEALQLSFGPPGR